MTAIKITKFLGTAPRNSSELLSDTAAQTARNMKLYSGDLIPYPQPVVVDNTKRTGTIQTLYGIRPSAGGPISWVSFNNYVNIVTPATDQLEEHRFYYTGDGVPKISTYELAVGTSSGPYPNDYYDLGLPLPKTKVAAAADAFSPSTAISYARDAAGIVTVKTAVNHNIKSGAVISVSGFAYRNGLYSWSRDTSNVTITIQGHGLVNGSTVFLEFTTGEEYTIINDAGSDVIYTALPPSNSYAATVTGPDTFVVTSTVAMPDIAGGFGGIGPVVGSVKWDIRDFNTVAEVSVVDDRTLSYFSPGAQVTETTVSYLCTYTQTASATAVISLTANKLGTGSTVYLRFTSGGATGDTGVYVTSNDGTNDFKVVLPTSRTTSGNVEVFTVVGKIDLGDQLQGRSYLYTWFSPWREESIGSEPTEPIYIREGQVVRVTEIPTTKPAGKSNVGGVRLYRSLASTAGSNFYLLKTLWFPAAVEQLTRTTGTVTIKMRQYHNLLVDDRIKLVVADDPTFDTTDAVVTRIIDARSFEFYQPGDDVTTFTVTNGLLYYDVSEKKTNPSRYWGYSDDYSFTDDFNFRALRSVLGSTQYEKPPAALQGLTAMQNNILVGFVGNDLYFSEPNQYHAWPSQYRKSLEYDIVALVAYSGYLLVLTTGSPYLIEGSSPSTLIPQKLAVMYPCVSAKSVVQTSFGIVWATHDGLAVFGGGGVSLLSKAVHHSDTWHTQTDPENLVGTVFKDNYIASNTTAALTLESVEADGSTGLSFVDLDFSFTAAWYDYEENALYTVAGTDGDVYRVDDLTQQSMTARWKSKTFVTPTPVNLGAARVVADYDGEGESPLWEAVEDLWDEADILWNGGAVVTFNFYVNKQLIFTTDRTDSGIFRLPAGYKSDTFEVEVLSPMRVRAIHIAQTPLLLATV